MKLIHLPTGEVENHSLHIADALLAHKNSQYIRAELPQYWRVEGYENSWEWMDEVRESQRPENWLFVTNTSERKADGFSSKYYHLINLPLISKAEFEYHIYNPWKDGKSELKFKRETPMPWAVDPADEIFKPVREFKDSFKPSTLYNHMAENHNVTLLGSEENDIKQIVLNDIIDKKFNKAREYDSPIINELLEEIELDTLKQQAEKMGYELVQKTIKWQMGRFAFTLYMDGDCMIEDKLEDESFRVSVKMAEEIIEKYKQFKSYERI
jgi:hypothetical protein